ncbi:hypothetical protein CEE44_03615 [Candidatus Woesearchaeota archaeon B3_Woes]|nr:MAG: hypothetical protein CEE44_03615 [Candidatus Woesearchaeota archaeon B3_Woes]
MPVEEYLELRESAKIKVDTQELAVREAFIAAANSIRGTDGSVDYSILEEEVNRDAFEDAFGKSINTAINRDYGATTTDVIKQDQLWKMYCGFDAASFYNFVKQTGSDLELKIFEKVVDEQFKPIKQSLMNSAIMNGLTEYDGQNIVNYLKEDPVNLPAIELIDVNMLTNVLDMSKLLEEYLGDKGVVTPQFVENQPYAKLAK